MNCPDCQSELYWSDCWLCEGTGVMNDETSPAGELFSADEACCLCNGEKGLFKCPKCKESWFPSELVDIFVLLS